ncbi:MAG: VWA domain-containing protein [Oscillochloridaceae bacterium umkhey_bin13]
MFSLSFIYPALLWLLVCLPLLWLLAWLNRAHNLAHLGRSRYLALIVLRSIMLIALVLALAGVQIVRPATTTAVAFLIDGSDSVAPAEREQALAYVNAAMAAAAPDDRAAVVVFGAAPAVERAAGPPLPLNRLGSLVVGSRTDLADAIQLGLALLPADAQKRLVILSDGEENRGRAVEAARIATLRGVPIEVVPLATEAGPDLLLATLEAPSSAREGQFIPLRIQLGSNATGVALLELLADGELVATEEVNVGPGATTLTVSLPAGQAGFRRFEARVSAPFDTQPLNNRAATFTTIEGPPRLLLIADDPSRAAPLQVALEAADFRVEVRAASQTPANLSDLAQYAAVLLVDAPAASLPTAAQRALVTYVREQGGGLAMLGGENSFGAGGWRRTPLAAILPVELDPPLTEQRPDLALALVIDRSGSMTESAGTGRNRLDLAKDAVFLATRGMAQADQIGVFVFDEVAVTVLPIQPLPDLVTIEDALSRVSPGGGTNIRAGVELGANALLSADARVKHLILLTDGLDSSNYTDLIDQLRAEGSTVTIVSIGGDANPSLEGLAARGGGAFYRVTRAQEVPSIFLSETIRVAGRDLVEEPFVPLVGLDVPPVRGLGPLPPLLGHNVTTARESARTILFTPDGDPVLAVWQVGLGRSLVWTSDLYGRWGRNWLAWPSFAPFVAGLADALQPPVSEGLELTLRIDVDQAIIEVTSTTALGGLEGRLLDPAGQPVPLSFSQIGPNRFRAVTVADQPGVYLAQAAALDPQGASLGITTGGLVVSYSPEYRPLVDGASLLADLANLTGGQVLPPPETSFLRPGQTVGQVREIAMPLLWLALLLLPFDIALRRLLLRPADLRLPQRTPRSSSAPAPDGAMARLQAARARVQRPNLNAQPTQDPVTPTTTPVPPAPTPVPPAATPVSPVNASTPATPPVPPAKPLPPAHPDDPVAALLAAKRRRKP